MREKYLITGAHGFIGSRLMEMLSEKGHGSIALAREALTSSNLLEQTLQEVRPDVIYHLAAYGNHYQQTDRAKIFNANLFGTFNLLEASKNLGYQALVNTGSSSEYGRQAQPMAEGLLPETDTFYGAAKVGTTFLARAYAIQFGLPIVTVRPFSVYGPCEAAHRFIPTVIRCALTGEELTLAPGVHDWIYIDDFIAGLLIVTDNAKQLAGEVVNIGSGQQYTNKEVVATVEQVLGKKIKVRKSGGLRVYDTEQMWVSNNTKLQGLGWKPNYDLVMGITKTIDAIRTDQ